MAMIIKVKMIIFRRKEVKKRQNGKDITGEDLN